MISIHYAKVEQSANFQIGKLNLEIYVIFKDVANKMKKVPTHEARESVPLGLWFYAYTRANFV